MPFNGVCCYGIDLGARIVRLNQVEQSISRIWTNESAPLRPGVATQGLVKVGDVELAQLQAGHGDQGLDVQLLPTEDGCGVRSTGMIKYGVCSIKSRPNVFFLAVIVCSQCERVHL